MLFAISRGSDGAGTERYTVYVPFTLAPGASLEPLDTPALLPDSGYQVTLEKLHYLYALALGPFASLNEANSYIDKVRASLLWLSLKFSCGVSYPKANTAVNLLATPAPLWRSSETAKLAATWGWDATEGHYDADKAVIRPEHKKLVRWELGRVSVSIGINNTNFLHSVQEAFNFPRLERVIENAKLKLAIEIYATYRFELSETAQLITLVTALEALLPITAIPEHSSAGLLQAKNAIRAARDMYSKDTPAWSDLNRLLSRVGNLERGAIGTGLREFAAVVASRHPEIGNGQETADKLQAAYAVRSTLLHQGRSDDIATSLEFLRDYVPRLLRVLYAESAGPSSD